MKKIISLFLMALLPLCANAYDAKIDGIYYNFNTETKTATVTYCYENNNNKNAYRGKVNIPATVNYEGETYDVAVIGGSAFRYCSDLTSVTIPGSVTRIDSYAFANCRGLTYVTIPNSVTSIGYYAFYECYGLTSVHISDIAAWCKISFSSYENNPLYYAKHLYLGEEEIKDLVIPNSVTSIEKYAFSGCSGLTSVTIPNSVTSIGWEAFQYCSGLASVHISDIAAWCNISFVNNTSNPLCYAHHLYLGDEEIKDLVIQNSVTSIGGSAFYACSGLTSVTIPNSVTSIGAYAFFCCSGLTSVTIPNSVTSIEGGAFWGCSGLTSVTIPNSVASIDIYVFKECRSLTSVTIPNSVTSIGKEAFSGCSSLTSVTIPNSVTSIESNAFEGCSSLSTVLVPVIDYFAFCNNKALGGISSSLGKPVQLIDTEGKEITEYIVPDGVTSIESSAFRNCTGLTSITIPNSVTSIGAGAFYGCSGLTSITIPNSVTSIREYTFQKCSGLTSVTIPNSVTSIGEGAFFECSGLTSVMIPNSVTSIGVGAFNGCSGLTSVTIPNSVKSIEKGTFSRCSGLTYVKIPNSVTNIRESAFMNCSGLNSLTIGSGVRGIYSQAFAYCEELVDVYCLAEVVPTMYNSSGNSGGTDAFLNSYIGYVTLHVPTASIGAYRAKEPWKNFKEIKALNDEEIPNIPGANKCDKPNIIKEGNKFWFECETPGATIKGKLTPNVEELEFEGSEMVFKGGDITYTLTVIASAEGYEDSDPVKMTLTVENCDVNKDGTVDVADIATIISRMAGKARIQEETEE